MALPSGDINDLLRLCFAEDENGNPALRVISVGLAENTPIVDTAEYFTATDVEAALAELAARVLAITPVADGTYTFEATTPGNVASMEVEAGLITGITVVPA